MGPDIFMDGFFLVFWPLAVFQTTFDLYNIWFISTIKLNEFFRFYRMNILKFNITAESLRVSLASGQKQRV